MNKYSNLIFDIRYSFKDFELLETSLTHSSFDKNKKNYEKLEFLGDRILGLVISINLYKNFKKDSEGELAKKHSFLVCKKTLINVASLIHLHRYIKVSNDKKMKSIDSIKANALEALIAAVFLDSDFETVQTVVENLWKEEIKNIDLSKYDPKSRLQELCLKENNKLPEYNFVSKTGPEHEPIFKISVNHSDDLIVIGEGKNKQDAEVNAAKLLLKKIENKKI